MWNKGGLWIVRIRHEKIRLAVPLPLYVLADALESAADLCALILPRVGLPNYPAELLQLVRGLGESNAGEPLADIESDGVRVTVRRLGERRNAP